jgi:hypothetical protein
VDNLQLLETLLGISKEPTPKDDARLIETLKLLDAERAAVQKWKARCAEAEKFLALAVSLSGGAVSVTRVDDECHPAPGRLQSDPRAPRSGEAAEGGVIGG